MSTAPTLSKTSSPRIRRLFRISHTGRPPRHVPRVDFGVHGFRRDQVGCPQLQQESVNVSHAIIQTPFDPSTLACLTVNRSALWGKSTLLGELPHPPLSNIAVDETPLVIVDPIHGGSFQDFAVDTTFDMRLWVPKCGD